MDYWQGLVLQVLSRHIGRGKAINMAALFTEVYGAPPRNTITGTRRLREIITRLRTQGVPICSAADMDGGGYYLPAAGSELEAYCGRLRSQALKKLKQEAELRKVALPQLLGQIQMNLEG
jgi:hypothetical protein